MEDWKQEFAHGVKVEQITTKPELPISVVIPVPVKMYMAPEINGTTLRFKLTDSVVHVTHNEKELGTIEGCLGGCIEVNFKLNEKNYGYIIRPDDIWRLFMTSLASSGVQLPEGYK